MRFRYEIGINGRTLHRARCEDDSSGLFDLKSVDWSNTLNRPSARQLRQGSRPNARYHPPEAFLYLVTNPGSEFDHYFREILEMILI
jgi:hypothetical protein